MAGSYSHVEHGWSLIENMGDAHEATEELLWLVWYLARKVYGDKLTVEQLDVLVRDVLDKHYYPMRRRELPKDDLIAAVSERMEK